MGWLQLIESSAADDAVVAELLEAAAVDGDWLEAVVAVGSTAGHVSVAVAVGIHKTDTPVLLHCPSVQKSSHPFSMLNAKFFHCNIMAMIFTPQKYPFQWQFLVPPGPGKTLGWGIKVSQAFISIACGVFWPIIQFPCGLFLLHMASCHFG